MKSTTSLAFMIGLCLGLAAAGTLIASMPDNVALVTAMSGAAEMEVAGATSTLSVGQELAEGATIRVSSGTLSIVFFQGAFLEIKTGEVIVLGKDPASSKITDGSGTRGIEESQTVNVSQSGVAPGGSQEQLMKLAYIPGVRGDRMVIPLAPRLTISSASPTFYWFDTDSASAGQTREYLLVVKDQGDAVIFQKSVEGKVFEINSQTFPELQRMLKVEPEKHFSWTIAEAKSSGSATGAGFMYVDDAGLQKESEKRTTMEALAKDGKIDTQSFHTLMALFYLDERERLFSDAFPHLFALMNAPGGGNRFALRNLALVLDRFGNQVSVVSGHISRQLLQSSGK